METPELLSGTIYREYTRLTRQGFLPHTVKTHIAKALSGRNYENSMEYIEESILVGSLNDPNKRIRK